MLALRPFQKQALNALAQKSHAICIAPTGSGKTLVIERLAAAPGRRTLLVAPLIALARQLHDRLQAAGLPVALSSGGHIDSRAASPSRPYPSSLSLPRSGIWIVSPETLLYPSSLERLRAWRPDLLVVDECHCFWDWGDGFRPAFVALPDLIQSHQIARSLWLTATLPRPARDALRASLAAQGEHPVHEIGRFGLPARLELRIARVPLPLRLQCLASFVKTQAQAGIVFVNTREGTERIARVLESLGRKVIRYHAGLGREERLAAERQIAEASARRPDQDPDAAIIVATSAFGMGMDYAHLRWVALWQTPPSLLALAQTIGRVSRGGQSCERSVALVLWDRDDFRLLEWTVANSLRKRDELRRTFEFLCAPDCRESALQTYFDGLPKTAEVPCGRCDRCQDGA